LVLSDKLIITGRWRKLCNEELYDSYCPPDIVVVTGQAELDGHLCARDMNDVRARFWWKYVKQGNPPL